MFNGLTKKGLLLGVVVFASCFLIAVSKNVPEKKDSSTDKTRTQVRGERRSKSLNTTQSSSTAIPDHHRHHPQAITALYSPAAPLMADPAAAVASSSLSSSSSGGAKVFQKSRRLIHGSKNAVTITRKEYLKKDWCKTEPFEQVVEEEGCIKKRVKNRFCYGQCNSFFIPKTEKQDDGASSFQSCAYCTPKVVDWMVVVLRCPRRNPPVKRKRIQIIKQCKCMAAKLEDAILL